ncbi:hypothetical protein, partial [uncultured Bacteroides sp.]
MADINDAGWRDFPCNQRSIGYGIEDDEDMAPWAYAVYDPDFNLLVHIKNTFEELWLKPKVRCMNFGKSVKFA